MLIFLQIHLIFFKRINNTIKNSIPSTKISLVVPIVAGQNNHTLQIEGDNFKNIPVNTEIYFYK